MDYSTGVSLKAATSILDLHQNLVESDSHVLCLMRNDLLAAVYCVCHAYSTSRPDTGRYIFCDKGQKPLTSCRSKIICFEQHEYTREYNAKPSKRPINVGECAFLPYYCKGFTDARKKMTRLGVGIQEYYSICAVIALLEKQSSVTVQGRIHEYQAADTCCNMIMKLVSSQDADPSRESSRAEARIAPQALAKVNHTDSHQPPIRDEIASESSTMVEHGSHERLFTDQTDILEVRATLPHTNNEADLDRNLTTLQRIC